MKYFLVLILVLFSTLTFSQVNDQAKYFLNGNEIKWSNTFLNPKSIKSIHVNQRTKESPNGEIHFETENLVWKSYTLEKLLKESILYNLIKNKSIIPIFVIDRQMIHDPEKVQIDSSYFWSVNVDSLSNIKGFPEEFKKLVLIDIELTTEKLIFIRGSNILKLDSLKTQIK
jgi:hypothetical protein